MQTHITEHIENDREMFFFFNCFVVVWISTNIVCVCTAPSQRIQYIENTGENEYDPRKKWRHNDDDDMYFVSVVLRILFFLELCGCKHMSEINCKRIPFAWFALDTNTCVCGFKGTKTPFDVCIDFDATEMFGKNTYEKRIFSYNFCFFCFFFPHWPTTHVRST